MDGATPAAFEEMKRLAKFVMDTDNYGLKVLPTISRTKKWKMTVYTDSDWAGDKDNRHSVSVYAIFLNDTVILWKSKLQKPLALSSSEAEYYGMSEAAKDVKFVAMILEAIGIEIELPIIMYCDNVGAIFMAENATATVRTKHVNARYHFVREYVESGFLKVVFVNSKENKSDIFTKNVSGELYDKHKGTYIIRRQEVEPIRNIEGRVLKK
jgi:hypothetical protein